MEPPNKMKKSNTKNYFHKKNQHNFLEVGQRGFVATCNFREKDCVRECYNILNQYANELYGPEVPVAAAENNEDPNECTEASDISDVLQKEINDVATAKKAPPRLTRFQAVTTGATNFLFIRTNLPDPVELGTRIIEDIATTRKQVSRFLLRLLPVEIVCSANFEKIIDSSTKLIEKHFTKEGKTFSIVLNKRYNNNIKKLDLITPLAQKISAAHSGNTVNLSNPEKTLVMEIVKGFCCLAVVDGYMKYKRYNLVELANPNTQEKNGVEAKDDESKDDESKDDESKVDEAKADEAKDDQAKDDEEKKEHPNESGNDKVADNEDDGQEKSDFAGEEKTAETIE